MKARDLMTADPFVVTPKDSVKRAAELMRNIRVGCLPVVDDPERPILRGIITDRDITVRCVSAGHVPGCTVERHMTAKPLQTVDPDDDVSEVVVKMESGQLRRIPVVNDDEILIGIIAQADLATKLGPTEPLMVEAVLQRISTPANARV
jgi:CBS domain-containing protein